MLSSIWPPYRPLIGLPSPPEAVSTSGCLIHLADGRTLVDGMASWWTACHGYNHPGILAAVNEQLHRMPHIMFGGLTHAPAEALADKLLRICNMPDGGRVFFSDSGSVAVEVAMKMAVQFWQNCGYKNRTKFLSFNNSYHGDTLACMSLADPAEGFHGSFGDYIPRQHNIPIPDDEATRDQFIKTLDNDSKTLAAVVIEPLVQGAGGMKFHSTGAVQFIAKECKKRDILLILDEIFTGFGRVGSMFAYEHAAVTPDILCVGKALTGGVLGLAATLASSRVVDGFLSSAPSHALMHGPTYMANPLACAAANASIDIFAQENRLSNISRITNGLSTGLLPCQGMENVKDVRIRGAIGVVELKSTPNQQQLSAMRESFLQRNVWVRPFGNIVYLTPALTISEAELGILTSAVRDVVAAQSKNGIEQC